MGRGISWMLASSVQVPRKGKGDMEELSTALQASTGGYRSILEQADQCMYVCMSLTRSIVAAHYTCIQLKPRIYSIGGLKAMQLGRNSLAGRQVRTGPQKIGK